MVCIIWNYKLAASYYIAQKLCAIGILIAAFCAFCTFQTNYVFNYCIQYQLGWATNRQYVT